MIDITENVIPIGKYHKELCLLDCGGIVAFEGRIRNHNDGKEVKDLSYECYKPMGLKVLDEIVQEAYKKWDIKKSFAIHRIGNIPLGEIAVWVGVASHHRKEAFEVCRFIIDEIKQKVPIWKYETYTDGSKSWIEGCKH